MYRSFMTCDDPKGVVECGTIRKYRTSSQKMKDKKTKILRTAENSDISLTSKPDKEEELVSKGSTEKKSWDPSSSSLHLIEVSRGAQRLNNMIDSWSKGLGYDGRSEDIAKDLLKGALDLQESLVMLHRVQEASQHMARLKRKQQNEKPERGRFDAKTKMIDSSTTHGSRMGFQRPFLPSADASSSTCTEELKKVIKESLVRQNLLPTTSTEALDSESEFCSTNASQSSGFWVERLSDCSFSPTASKKERGPSLVAKLMGLEEVHSRSFPAAMQKQLEAEKILNQKRPLFEVDLPTKVRKNNAIVEKVNPEGKKTLREILETTHFKGLLKESSVREPKLQVHNHFNYPHPKEFDDLPPIVLMKPRRTSYREFVKSHEPVSSEELPLRRLKAKAAPSKMFKHREGSTNMGKEMEEDVTRRLTKEERLKNLKVVELDVKEIRPIENEKAPSKVKLYSHASHKSQVSETSDKKAKVKTISRKPPEMEISKSKIVTRSQDQREITPTKLRKPQSGSRIDKNEIPSQKSNASNAVPKTNNQQINNSKEQRKNLMKKQKPIAEPEAAVPVAEELGVGQGEEKSIDVSYDDDCAEIKIITTLADELAMEHEVDAFADKIREDCKQSHSSSADDIMLQNSEHENGAIPAREAHDSTNCSETNSKPEKQAAELKYLLLTSQSFIGHAEELLNLDLDCPKIIQKNEVNGIANLRLFLDCANELTERKSLQESQLFHSSLPSCAGNSRLQISLGRLVEEICNAIENLKSYSENPGKKLSVDNIYAMMDRDMKCNGLINGIWNWGWRHGFSADEAEQVVNEVESLVLSGLIEEVIINL